MGYTTEFEGRFDLNKPLDSLEIYMQLKAWHDNHPSNLSYLQWELTPDRKGLQWDGNEKFYDYVEWLKKLLEYMKPLGYSFAGKVRYRGEDMTDIGIIEVKDGIVTQIPNANKKVTCPHCGEEFILEDN